MCLSPEVPTHTIFACTHMYPAPCSSPATHPLSKAEGNTLVPQGPEQHGTQLKPKNCLTGERGEKVMFINSIMKGFPPLSLASLPTTLLYSPPPPSCLKIMETWKLIGTFTHSGKPQTSPSASLNKNATASGVKQCALGNNWSYSWVIPAEQ